MDGTCYRCGCNRASFNLKNLAHVNVCEIFLLYYVAVVKGAATTVHAVAEIVFGVSESVSHIVACVVNAAADITREMVNIVAYTVVIFTFISVCVVNVGCTFVTVAVMSDISVVASVNIAASRA